MILNVITPLSRPENVPLLRESLRNHGAWELRWHVACDALLIPPGKEVDLRDAWTVIRGQHAGFVGNQNRNACLDAIANSASWVWFFDDDNLVVPGFFEEFHAAAESNPMAMGFVFDQTNAMELKAVDVVAGRAPVDSAMFAFRRDAIGSLRWHPTKYDADGLFYAAMNHRHPGRIVPISKALVSHNALRPETHQWIADKKARGEWP